MRPVDARTLSVGGSCENLCMGKSSRKRREAAQRRAQPKANRSRAEIIDLIGLATRFASVSQRVVTPKVDELNAIGAAASSSDLDPAVLVVDEVLARIHAAWEHGWQPSDLAHAARRRTSGVGAKWIARALLVQADRTRALDHAPKEWTDQLRALAARHQHAGGPDGLLAVGGRAGVAEWTVALVMLDWMRRLPRSELLLPPPSRWGRARPSAPTATQHGRHPAKTLTKIRALLAKAESTDFAAEAEAFTAKAQDLMTRHAIDEALLADEAGESVDVGGTRVLIHHPYGLEKATLLDVIARANRTRAIWNDFSSCVTLVGVPTDVAQVDMLFTSTLVQATRAMTQAGRDSHGADRSSSFRKAFLSAYAVRIGERLAQSSDQATDAYGSALVPVLQRQADAVEGEFERLFPHVTTKRRRASFDARGWDAGTRAADAAVLPAAEVGTGG